MHSAVGVLVMEHIAVGLVENNKLAGPLNIYPEKGASLDALQSMPAENIGDCIRQQIDAVAKGQKIHSIWLGFPGVIRDGIIEDSPNLHQVKGFNLQAALSARGLSAPVRVVRDTSPAGKEIRRPFAPRIEALPPALLRERLSACARWQTVKETKEGLQEAAARPHIRGSRPFSELPAPGPFRGHDWLRSPELPVLRLS